MERRTREKLVLLTSLLESRPDRARVTEAVEGLGNATLQDALQNPYEALLLLSGDERASLVAEEEAAEQNGVGGPSGDVLELAGLCGGDVEYAQDVLHGVGGDLAAARAVLGGGATEAPPSRAVLPQQSSSSSSSSSSTSSSASASAAVQVVDLIKSGALTKAGSRESHVTELMQLCGGNREFAASLYESAGHDLAVAKALLE